MARRVKQQELKVEIVNPEALEKASEKYTEVLVDIWWEREMEKAKENKLIAN